MVWELIKSLIFGIVEGITEWLPISSTGHLILLDEFLKLDATDNFKEMFDVVIQLGAILASSSTGKSCGLSASRITRTPWHRPASGHA